MGNPWITDISGFDYRDEEAYRLPKRALKVPCAGHPSDALPVFAAADVQKEFSAAAGGRRITSTSKHRQSCAYLCANTLIRLNVSKHVPSTFFVRLIIVRTTKSLKSVFLFSGMSLRNGTIAG